MLDNISINFDPASLVVLNIILAVLMFGVSLNLKISDFSRIIKAPVAPSIGLVCQFIILPAITFGLTMLLHVPASMALGMILVSSCPGGVFSNVMTFLGKGSVATSVTMTAISSMTAVVMTPFNFAFYAAMNPATNELLTAININVLEVFALVLTVLGLPLLLGMWIGKHYPKLVEKSVRSMRILSLLVFISFVLIAFVKNLDIFAEHWQVFLWLVVLHNSCALLLGNVSARLFTLSVPDRRALTFEVGIQNSGLGLVLLFTFMPTLGGAMIITAFWGVWHLVSGLTLALFWSRDKSKVVAQ
ncbi:bile acid:sodium symporter family protein [uncultured Paraglaciecola sp.]|uniref:bile acid:sodium symporter family protein n=1 Tax=uncultured Paraglaciecola sp. TaxID=1765024 RepID=UPI002613B5DD|nr:bile acid:sodium symporter family protein [uncultured Paraglaciecola sp.]